MGVVGKTSAGAALVLLALLFLWTGPADTPAFAQYDVPPGGQYGQYQYGQYQYGQYQYGQYGLLPGDRYGLPEDQYGLDDGQYGLAPGDQYDPPPTTAASPPESQDGAPTEDRNVGGDDTGNGDTAPGDEGNDAGGGTGNGSTAPGHQGSNENDDDATESTAPPERPTPGAGGIGSLNGVLVGGVVLLAVLSLIAALAFLIERRGNRRGW